MLPLRWYNDWCSCTQTDLKEGKESFFLYGTLKIQRIARMMQGNRHSLLGDNISLIVC